MSDEERPKIAGLLVEARKLRADGDARQALSLGEQAARQAEALGEKKLAYMAHDSSIDFALDSGAADRMLVHFAYCLAQCDRDPSAFHERSILWKQKWIVSEAPAFPTIPRDRIAALLDDMQTRFVRNGATLRAVHERRMTAARDLGDFDETGKHLAAWQAEKRDYYSDCIACEADELAHHHADLGDDDAALEAARPILDRSLSCHEVPHATHPLAMRLLQRKGRDEEARALFQGAVRRVAGRLNLIVAQGDLLLYAAKNGHLRSAALLAQKHVANALAHANPYMRMKFCARASAAAAILVAPRRSTVKWHLPEGIPGRGNDGGYALTALRDHFAREARDLAAQFDSRNGNANVSGFIERSMESFLA